MEAGNASIGCEQRRSGQSCPSQRSAEPSVKTGAVGTVGDWVAGEAFMVIPNAGFSPACAVRATAQRRQRRTADLVPDWLGSQHP